MIVKRYRHYQKNKEPLNLSQSVGKILLCILTFTRNSILDQIVIFKTIAAVGGVWLYSYLGWVISWLVLYKAIGKKYVIGNMRAWLMVIFVSLAIATILIESSLEWPPLF